MVTAREVVSTVVDPEIRVVTIDDLGILRDVTEDHSGHVTVTITPTYSGCPAMDVIRDDIRQALAGAGYPDSTVVTRLTPPWTTDLISEAGRRKLAAAGIAPPHRAGGATPLPQPLPRPLPRAVVAVACPRCGSVETEELARFGSTACKSLHRCRACREPFDHVKPL